MNKSIVRRKKIPIFPNFRKLKLEDKLIVERLTKKYLPYSDFNFTSLYGYDTKNILEISILNENLVVLFTDYITNKPFYSFIGNKKPIDTSIKLLQHAKEKNLLPFLKLIPEINITKHVQKSNSLEITEDRDNFDYILSVDDLVSFSKKIYSKKKQFASFSTQYPNAYVSSLNLTDKKTRIQMLDVFDSWRISRKKTINETKNELIAIKRITDNSDLLKLYGLGIYFNKQLIGFSIASLDNKTYAEFHFSKANTMFKGIFSFLYINLAQHLKKLGFKYMNIQQDLGLPSLREAKNQWRPVKFLKKFTISLKV